MAEDHAEIFMPTWFHLWPPEVHLTSYWLLYLIVSGAPHALVVPKYTCLLPAPACYAVLYKTTTGPTYFHISEISSVPLHSHISWGSSPANLIFWISLGNKFPSPFQQALLLARPWYFLPLHSGNIREHYSMTIWGSRTLCSLQKPRLDLLLMCTFKSDLFVFETLQFGFILLRLDFWKICRFEWMNKYSASVLQLYLKGDNTMVCGVWLWA